MPEAIETFKLNHPEAIADCRSIEDVDPAEIRQRLGLEPGELDVLVGGPPCQGFSINAPDRFLEDPRNALFRHYERFLEEFQPKTFLFENVPGLLSLGDGKVFRLIRGPENAAKTKTSQTNGRYLRATAAQFPLLQDSSFF